MKQKLTGRSVDSLKLASTGQYDIYDTVLPGFGVRVGTKGKSWFVKFRSPEKRHVRRMTLGKVGIHSLADARDVARDALKLVGAGKDPIEDKREQDRERERQKLVTERAKDFTVAAAAERFIEDYAKPNLRSWRDYDTNFRLYVIPLIGSMQIDNVERRDVTRVLDKIVREGKGRTAGKTLAAVRKMFNWLVGRGELEANPIIGIQPPAQIRHRERYLKDDELLAVWNAADDLGHPFGTLYRLLILTGARLSEVAGMNWAELDLDGRVWIIPADRSKNNSAHIVPLPDLALDLVAEVPRFEGGEYLLGRKGGTALSGFGKGKARMDAASGVENWRTHDLRRTFATVHQKIGTRLEVTEALLNHISGSRAGIVGVYQRHEWGPEKRTAMDAYDRWLRDLIEGSEVDNVIPIMNKIE